MEGGIMKNRRLKNIAVLITAALLAGAASLSGQSERDKTPVISISGTGEGTAVPDILELTVGVRTEAPSSGQALSRNNQDMDSLIEMLKKSGIPDKDIRTRNVRLYPDYKSEDGERRVAGYTAVNTVRVTIREIEKAGTIIDQAVRAGGNTVEGMRFFIEDPGLYAEEARKSAFEDARRKAEQLAELAGMELDTVMSLSESSHLPSPVTPSIMREAKTAASVPVEPGVQSVRVNVQVTWSMKKK